MTGQGGAGLDRSASDGVGDVRVEAEGELALARLALDDGELEHCASHLGNAVAEDPTLPAVYELLDELAARGSGPELFPRTGHDHAGAVAARAHLAARAGDYAEALSCLAMVAGFDPTKAWASGGWLDRPELAAEVDPQAALRAIVSITGKLGDELPDGVVRALTPFLAFTRRLVAAHPGEVDILPMLSGLPRRMGQLDEAIAWCERAEAAAPSLLSAVMLGNALRRAGRVDETLRVWLRGLDRDPHNIALHVDVAEEVDRQGRLGEALEWLDRALAIDPTDQTAYPSACEMRFRATGDVSHLVALVDHWRMHPEHSYANDRLSKVCDGRVWLDHPPHPTEAISNGAAQLYGRDGDDDPAAMEGELALSALEVPSAVAAFSAALPRIRIAVQGVPAPDLRVRFAPGAADLWRYEGTTPHPAVAPPSAAAVEAARNRHGWLVAPAPGLRTGHRPVLGAGDRSARAARAPGAAPSGLAGVPPAGPGGLAAGRPGLGLPRAAASRRRDAVGGFGAAGGAARHRVRHRGLDDRRGAVRHGRRRLARPVGARRRGLGGGFAVHRAGAGLPGARGHDRKAGRRAGPDHPGDARGHPRPGAQRARLRPTLGQS